MTLTTLTTAQPWPLETLYSKSSAQHSFPSLASFYHQNLPHVACQVTGKVCMLCVGLALSRASAAVHLPVIVQDRRNLPTCPTTRNDSFEHVPTPQLRQLTIQIALRKCRRLSADCDEDIHAIFNCQSVRQRPFSAPLGLARLKLKHQGSRDKLRRRIRSWPSQST